MASSDNPGSTMMVRLPNNSSIDGLRNTTDPEPFGFSYWEVLQWDAPTSASSSSSAKGMISMTPGATPFYTISPNSMTPSVLACLGNLTNLSNGGYCNSTWRVNATGTVDTTWEFYVDYSQVNKSAKLLSPLSGNLTGVYTDFGGNYSNLTNNDTSYWYVGNENTDILPYEVISAQEFSYTLANIDRGTVSNLTLNLIYCHSGNGASSVGCTGTAPTGTVEVDQNVSIFNYNLNKWLSLGSLDINTAGNEKESNFYPNGTLSGYINISDNTIKFRVRAHFTNTILGSSTFLVMDMANLTVSYRGYMNNLTSNQTQRINITIVANSAPSVSSISISPSTPSGSSDLNCTFYINDNALDELSANVSWYNGTALGYSEIISVQKNLQYVRTLAAGNTTPNEQWKCGATPFDGELYGAQLNSSTVTIQASQPPTINSIECQEDGITWEGCPNILFYNNLTAVRANCTDSDGTISNVTFNLTNLNDPIYYFNSNATYNALGFFVYNNSDINISDSGSFNLSVQCHDDSGVINYNNSVWTIPFGTLTAQLISPVSDANATQNRFFNFTSSVTCSGGECGYINATLDPFGTWALSNWSQRKQINISNIGVSSLTNFPAYLNITYDSDMQADFDDLRFTNGSCGSDAALLDYEVENITSANAEIWVRIPTLYSGINSICMYYGNPVALQGNNSASVWDSSYAFVQHLHQTPSDGVQGVQDSTSNGRDGTPNNFQDGGGGTTNAPGKIDGADDFGGDDDDIDFSTGCLSSSGNFSVEAWFNAENPANFDRLFTQGTTACAAREIMIFWNGNQMNGRLGGGSGAAQVATAAFSANAWHHLVWTFDGSAHIMYLDGSVSSGTPIASTVGVGGNLYLGRRDTGNYWDGLIDEVRVSTAVRSGAWANESYQLVVNQSVLVKNGAEENRTKGIISTNIGASPFYTIDSNPMNYINASCLANMKSGDSCYTTWRVNTTGPLNTNWEFFVNYSIVNYSSSMNHSLTSLINITIIQNIAPNATAVTLLPSPAATSEDLNCSYKIDDYNTFDSITANISFYRNNIYNYSSTMSVTNHATGYFIFGNGNTTTGDSWICGVTPIDELTSGLQKNSTAATILSSLPPVVVSLTCQENGTLWEDCSNIRFTDILTAVRINCTSTIGLKNATFNFTNLPDQRTYFFNTTNRTDSGGLYVFNNTDIAINDSGEFSMNASCIDIANVSSVTYTNWTLPWGTLSVSLIDPASATNVERNAFFSFTAQVICTGGECGNVNATLDPQSTDLVYSVENFTITLASGVANASAIVTKGQNLSNSIPFASRMSNDPTGTTDNWASMNANVSFSGSNSVIVERGETTSTVTVNIYVVEFNPVQVRVQRGSFAMAAASSQATSSVTAVNTNKTAMVFYYGGLGTNPEHGANAVRGNFTANNTLRFSRGGTTGAIAGSYYLFEDLGNNFNVQPVDFSLSAAQVNSTHAVNELNLNRTFLIGSYEVEDTGDLDGTAQKTIRLDFPNNRTVQAIRNQSTGVINISAYAITFNSGLRVQRGYFFFPAGDTLESSSISAVDLNNSVPWLPVRQPGTHSSGVLASSDNPGATMMVRFDGNSTINGVRATTDIDPFGFSYWEVLQWDAPTQASTTKGVVSMTAGTIPFYTTSQNPMNGTNNSCLSGMVAGRTCQVAWQVNATGANNLTSEFFVDFNLTSNRAYVSDGQTPHVNITITDATVVPPVVTLVSPANATITRNTTILFNCSATDNSQLKNITFYSNFNGVFGVNGSSLVGGKSNQTNFTRTLTDGVYQWNCVAYDTDGNSDQGNSNRTITIDTTAPTINLTRPLNNSAFTGAIVDFNFTVTDNIDTSLFCNITLDSVIVDTNFAALNGSVTSRTINDLTQGNHKWNVTCVDDAQNSGTSFTFNFSIIDIEPTVNLTAPANGSLNPYRNINLSYNASDNNGVENASLILDGIVNQTDNSVPNGIIDFFTVYNLSEGYHNWTVNVTDISGLSDIKPVRYFLVDYSPPLINLTGPPYNFTSNLSSVEFNFTAIDNFDTVLVCNLTINGSVADSNFNANNGTIVSRTVSGLTDGPKLWNVTCKDDGNVTNTSQSWIVNISVKPTVSLNSPPSGYMQNSPNISLYYTPNDNTNITSCTLLLDGISNLSNSTISLNAQNNFTLTNLQSRVYNWTVNCTDPIGLNAIASPVRNFTIDFGKPNITLFYPLQNQSIFNSQIDFNFSVTDDIDTLLSCNLTLDGVVNISGIQSPNGTIVNNTIIVTASGNHFWNVTCIDDAGNFNVSETRNFTTYIPPTVILISPADNEVINHTLNVTFEYTVDDSVAVPNASLIINGLVNQTVQNPVLGETSNFFYVNFSIEGFYTWTVNATNINGQTGTASTRNFTIDQTPPVITYNHPFNGENISSNNVTFNFTVTDNLDTLLDCNVTIDGIVQLRNLSIPNGTTQILYNISFDGLHNWSVDCTDHARLINSISTVNFTVEAPPNITLNFPILGYRTNQQIISFNYTPIDTIGFQNCTFFLDGVENDSSTEIQENVPNFFAPSAISTGAHNWTVNCFDSPPDLNNYTAPNQTFIIDLLGPNITLNHPSNGEVFNTDDIYFNFTATDFLGALNLTCNITLDTGVNVSNIFVGSGISNATLIENLSQGTHSWNATCWDDFNNTNKSATNTFTVNSPDLKINASGITFNNTNPDENDSIGVNATVFNIGGIPANNFSVLFYDGALLFGNVTVETLDSARNTTVNSTFNATRGLHQIFVNIFFSGIELNSSNNNATNNLSLLLPVINSPQNNTLTTNSTNLVNFTLFDFAQSSLNYTLYLDGIFNRTSASSDNLTVIAEFNLSEGIHRLIVEAFGPRVDFPAKELGNTRKKNSTQIYITVDQTAPISQFETINRTWFSDSTPEIRFNITDNLDSVLNYTLFINGISNQTNYTSNGTSTGLNLLTLSDGNYSLIIESFDDAGNRRNSTFIIINIDTIAPVPRIITLNNSNFTDSTPEINFNITDNLAPVINYTFYADNVTNRVRYVQNGVNSTDNLTSLIDGHHIIILEATDLAGNKANSSFINITIDSTAPTVTIDSPTEGQALGYLINLLTTVSDNFVGLSSVTYSLSNDSLYYFKNGTLNASTNFDDIWDSTADISESVEFMYINFTVIANDTFGNTQTAVRRFIVDNKRPSITFVVPLGHYFKSNFSLDVRIQNRNLTISTYNITNSTNSLVVNNSNASIYVSAFNWTNIIGVSNSTLFPEGFYNITVFASDESGNNRTSGSFFYVDRTPPNVTLLGPLNNSNLSVQNISFSFNATDNFASQMLCNITINGIVNLSGILALNGSNTSVNISGFNTGAYNWSVICTDNATNAGLSNTFYFNVTPPDLEVSASDIRFNTTLFEENINFTVFANITNIGRGPANNVLVQFFRGNPDNGGTQVGSDFILNLEISQNTTINVSTFFGIGSYDIFVAIDRTFEISELDETNNIANASVNISSYMIINGNITGNLVLQSIGNGTAYSWSASNDTTGNILVVDSDSVISWTNLTAIGTNITFENASNDFEDIDRAMNTTQLFDSVNRTFSQNGFPKSTFQFLVFSRFINSTPIVNSTNTSSFFTGILWDSSDINLGQYNGSQDLVFITRINKNQQGYYGTYDFEIKVPSKLREYKKPDLDTSVTFYVELR
ncbi:MAG TPA: DUF2341 domain-containing protein [Candidatus Nanoarchaeia archaeon]|nr:DUF2341 domain-containing protein [Candidatus Nanoarchaeia archaeon]